MAQIVPAPYGGGIIGFKKPRYNDELGTIGNIGKRAKTRGEKIENAEAEGAEAVKNQIGGEQSDVNKSDGRNLISDTKTVVDTIHFNITGNNNTTSTGVSYRDIELCSHTPFPTAGNRLNTDANTFGEVSSWAAVPGFPDVFGKKFPTYDYAKLNYYNALVLEVLLDLTITYKKAATGTSDSDFCAVWVDVFNSKSRSYNGTVHPALGRVGFRDIEEMFEQGRCVKLMTERGGIASHTDAQAHGKFANGKPIVKADADGRARFNLKIQPWRYVQDGPEGAVNASTGGAEEAISMYNYENTCGFDTTGSKHGHNQTWVGTCSKGPMIRIYWQPWRETDASTTKVDVYDLSIMGSIKTKWHYYNPNYISEEHQAAT